MHRNLLDDSAESYGRSQLDVPDGMHRSWADGDTVAREHQAGETNSPGHGKRDPRKKLRGTEVLEAFMAGVVAVTAVSIFLGGLMIGVIAVIAIAVRREDRRYTLAGDAPDRLSRSTRRLTGVGRRDLDPEFLRPAGGLVR
jgi:hypothetical protein